MVRWLERRTVELGSSTPVGRGGSVVRAPDCRVRRHLRRWGAVVRWLERRTVELGSSTPVGRGGSVVRAPDCRVRDIHAGGAWWFGG